MNAYFAVGTLVFLDHKHNRIERGRCTVAELDSPMIVVEVLRASLWGLGANESYRCMCEDGRLRLFYCWELDDSPNANMHLSA
jgi:hypothetical protein